MVSFWPFKGDDSSPASFEKSLSAISAKISSNQLQLDRLRQGLRRFKALSTLYGSIAYLIYAVIILLLLSRNQASPFHYGGIVGGPLGIYASRLFLDTVFNYRIAQISHRLGGQVKARGAIIEKLKSATKYNTTQELLEKYGGAPPSPQGNPQSTSSPGSRSSRGSPRSASDSPRRTNIPPPATANIRPQPASAPIEIHPQAQTLRMRAGRQSLPSSPSAAAQLTSSDSNASFAPSAFPTNPQYAAPASGPHWIDRILDLLMGEDETAVRNRVALICERCRLVNGQAPPGTKGLEEVGRWKCGGCGAMNGVESEARRMLALAHEEAGPVGRGAAASDPEPEPEHGEEKVADVTIET